MVDHHRMVVVVDVEEVVSWFVYCFFFSLGLMYVAIFVLFSSFWIGIIGASPSCVCGCRLQYCRSFCITTFIRVVTAGMNQEEPIPRMWFSAYTSLFHTLTNHLHLLCHLTCKKDVVEGEDVVEEAEEVVVAVDVPIMHLTMVPFWN